MNSLKFGSFIWILLFTFHAASAAPVAESTPESEASSDSTAASQPAGEDNSAGTSGRELGRDAGYDFGHDLGHFSALANGAILGLAIPSKYGVAAAWRTSRRWEFEAGYFTGSYELSNSFINVGGLRETVLSLDARLYAWRSLNFIFGLSRQSYQAKLGNDILGRTIGPGASLDLIEVQTLGLQLGFGNRWSIYDHFIFGVDWLVLNFPFRSLKSDAPVLDFVNDANDRARIQDAVTILRYLPTGAACKLALGYQF